MNFLKEVTCLCEQVEVAGLNTSRKLFSEWLIDMVHTLITWQHSLRISQSRAQIDNI